VYYLKKGKYIGYADDGILYGDDPNMVQEWLEKHTRIRCCAERCQIGLGKIRRSMVERPSVRRIWDTPERKDYYTRIHTLVKQTGSNGNERVMSTVE